MQAKLNFTVITVKKCKFVVKFQSQQKSQISKKPNQDFFWKSDNSSFMATVQPLKPWMYYYWLNVSQWEIQTWYTCVCSHLKHHSWFFQQICPHVGADDAVAAVKANLDVFTKTTAVIISSGLCISNGLSDKSKKTNAKTGIL